MANIIPFSERSAPISRKERFEVFKRDLFQCQYCGRAPPQVLLECDHIEPVARGGSGDRDNLITSCFDCNRGKSATPLNDVPQSLKDRAAETLERESQVAGYQRVMCDRRLRVDADAQEVLNLFCELYGVEGISHADFLSIKKFIERLGVDEVLTSCEYAKSRKPFSKYEGWKYFCGVCWGKIRDAEG